MAENRCVVCGEIIPEGRQVCPTCEVMSNTETEELATEIYTLFRSRPMSRALARHLYDKGWRKPSEGEWVYMFSLDGDKFYECSVCGRQEIVNCLCKERNLAEDRPYCHCGAKMKGGAE